MVQREDLGLTYVAIHKGSKEFYSKYQDFWSDLYECEYSLFHVFPITNETMKQLQVATERMGKIFLRLLDFCVI